MNNEDKIKQFCLIQLEILKDKENKLRKELLDCKIQREFIESLLGDLSVDNKHD
tara:strand:+ start:654 stop:815 length:162 start_codon:yes stop_codon:yes gene_type:complete